jgi:hypothetical protein
MTSERTAQLKFGGWGAGIGAVVAIILGFTWGGWVTAGTADEMSSEAVLATRSAICVAQFMKAPDHEEQLKAFQATESWNRREFVEHGAWNRMPGETRATSLVSGACADGIEVLIQQ